MASRPLKSDKLAAGVSLYDDGLKQFEKEARIRCKDKTDQHQVLDIFMDQHSNIADAKAAAGKLQEHTVAKRSHSLRIGHKEIIPAEWINKVRDNISNIQKAGDIAMKWAPESVSMAWFAISKVLGAVQEDYKLYQMFGAGIKDATDIMTILSQIDQVFYQRSKPGSKSTEILVTLFTELTAAYAAVLDFWFSVTRHVSAKTFGRFVHAMENVFAQGSQRYSDKLAALAVIKEKVTATSNRAFHEGTFDRFDDLKVTIDSMRDQLTEMKKFDSWFQEFSQTLVDVKGDTSKTVDNTNKILERLTTPWLKAKDRWEKLMKDLNPLKDTDQPRDEASRIYRESETCEWLQDDDNWTVWSQEPHYNSLLCITGQQGSGKTVAISAMVDQLLDPENEADNLVLYISCAMSSKGEMEEESAKSRSRVSTTLLGQMYRYALQIAEEDEENSDLLDKCLDAALNPKEEKSKKDRNLARREDKVPDLAETMRKMVPLLGRKVFVIVDAVNEMNEDDQRAFFKTLSDLVQEDLEPYTPAVTRASPNWSTEQSPRVAAMVGTRTNSVFEREARDGDFSIIDLSYANGNDINKILTTALEETPTWPEDAREEAVEKIKEMAGSNFKYVREVAIPFIREPYQGSSSTRLDDLPDGLSDLYGFFVDGLPPGSRDLLRTVLSLTLYANASIKVAEIMDAFSQVYLQTEADALKRAEQEERGSGFRTVSKLEIEQLERAGGPFMKVWTAMDTPWVGLQDIAQVRRFCEVTAQSQQNTDEHEESALCSRCKMKLKGASIGFEQKHWHLDLALMCLRHLNSPLFQKRFNLVPEEKDPESTDASVKAQEDEGYETQRPGDSEDGSPAASGEPLAASEANGEPEAATNGDTGEGNKAATETADNTAEVCEQKDSDQDSVASEGDDSLEDDEDEEDDSDEDPNIGNWTRWRYEINHWHQHLREAENLWPEEERVENATWQAIMQQIDQFTANTYAFFAWQKQIFQLWNMTESEEPWNPIHMAALLGLTSWAKHLLSTKNANPTELSLERNALQAAAWKADNRDMLKLLLENKVDPNYENTERIPGFYAWIWDDASREAVELLLEHGGNPKTIDKRNQYNSLHYFASEGEDPEVLELLLNPKDPEMKPDICARDDKLETPLHVLLRRRDVPIPLLEAYIKNGADIYAEDEDSEMPLQMACRWGDRKVVEILARDNKKIDDQDTSGRTAMHQAAKGSHVLCINALVEAGAEPNVSDHHDRSPLFYACLQATEDTAMHILEILQKRKLSGVEINKVTAFDQTPLRQAAGAGLVNVVKTLLESLGEANGETLAIVNKADKKRKFTALHLAAKKGHSDVVQDLVSHGAQIGVVDANGKTPLDLCCDMWSLTGNSSFEDTALLLIDGDTALAKEHVELASTAAMNGSKKVLLKLHEAGADLNKPDAYGWSPLALAKESYDLDAADFLRQQTAWPKAAPGRWVGARSVTTLSEDGMTIEHTAGTRYCISTERPLPAGLERFYYEMTSVPIVGASDGAENSSDAEQPEYPEMAIGFCTIGAAHIRFPGWPLLPQAPRARSWAYHGDDGGMYDNQDYAAHDGTDERRYKPGDTIGCGMDLKTRKIWFTKNGKMLKDSFEEVKGRLYPIIGLNDAVKLETNFGDNTFMWQDTGEDEGSERGSGSDTSGSEEEGEEAEEDDESGEEDADAESGAEEEDTAEDNGDDNDDNDEEEEDEDEDEDEVEVEEGEGGFNAGS